MRHNKAVYSMFLLTCTNSSLHKLHHRLFKAFTPDFPLVIEDGSHDVCVIQLIYSKWSITTITVFNSCCEKHWCLELFRNFQLANAQSTTHLCWLGMVKNSDEKIPTRSLPASITTFLTFLPGLPGFFIALQWKVEDVRIWKPQPPNPTSFWHPKLLVPWWPATLLWNQSILI